MKQFKIDNRDEECTVGDYIIKKTIGKGTFGKVKLGYHKPNNEKVAIKILEKNRNIMDRTTYFERELKSVRKQFLHILQRKK